MFFSVCVWRGGLQEMREMEGGSRLKVEDGGSKDGKRRGSERFLFL